MLAVNRNFLLQFVQYPVEVEPSDAALVHAFFPLAAVMETMTVLMTVMRRDVVSC